MLIRLALVQIRMALALASALNRTVVLPELHCGADRWWAPHAGNIPGSFTPLPFACPLDHVLDLEQCVALSHCSHTKLVASKCAFDLVIFYNKSSRTHMAICMSFEAEEAVHRHGQPYVLW